MPLPIRHLRNNDKFKDIKLLFFGMIYSYFVLEKIHKKL